ncbi:PHD finger-like domain-containing protein 5A [Acorus calamus]|uniref:PHD finger-like domain-containing protein 5A n=1 Tax=Acorus calamus TaxID=4465 RepID=A0AAV9C633_ACOCL|nr:PHD finger-like domain-containing protein 5A [Acorus calamus]
MAKHHPDLIMCRKQPGIAIGRLCEKCDGSASSATPTCGPARSSGSVMSAIMDHSRDVVLSAVVLASPMRTTAKSARSRRRTVMVARRLLTSGAPRPISSTNGRNTGSRNDEL